MSLRDALVDGFSRIEDLLKSDFDGRCLELLLAVETEAVALFIGLKVIVGVVVN
jgi:hypothetical protein